MEVRAGRAIPISSTDPSLTGNARRQAMGLAFDLEFSELRQSELGIIVTEAARNIAAHAGEGEIVLTPWTIDGETGIDVYALDNGPGIPDLERSFVDGYSTAGTPGQGLGAMSRLAGMLQVYSQSGKGTVVFARVFREEGKREEQSSDSLAALSVPIGGERVCGDGWAVHLDKERSLYMMADGLGHGIAAAEAAEEAIRVFRESLQYAPERILGFIHAALAKTRGAAVSVAEILHSRATVNYAGVGNIAAVLCHGNKLKNMVSMNGTAGHSVTRLQQFSYELMPGALLILHSDGLTTRWSLEQYPGLATRHPALAAGVLYRDFSRKRDDASILVSRL